MTQYIYEVTYYNVPESVHSLGYMTDIDSAAKAIAKIVDADNHLYETAYMLETAANKMDATPTIIYRDGNKTIVWKLVQHYIVERNGMRYIV